MKTVEEAKGTGDYQEDHLHTLLLHGKGEEGSIGCGTAGTDVVNVVSHETGQLQIVGLKDWDEGVLHGFFFPSGS